MSSEMVGAETFLRTAMCLQVFAERGLLSIEREGDALALRLTADGKLKPCLHALAEYSLKGLDYNGMLETMRTAILAKPAWHGELSSSSRSHAGRNMNQIGG